ncbi:MAG: hypothetical protein AAFN76_02215, partial [Pseudomonadota bacterium]
GGPQTVPGVGKVSSANIAAATENAETTARLRSNIETIAAIWGALDSTRDPIRRAELIEKHGEALTLASNGLKRDLDALGLVGGYE